MDISLSITICLKRQGKTQKQLAEHLDVTEATMTAYMKSRQHPRSNAIKQIADFFNMKVSEFIALGEDK